MCYRSAGIPGMANGSILIIRQLFEHGLLAEIASGPCKGTLRFIPRKSLMAPDHARDRRNISLCRMQLPLCRGSAFTINKAQGQTLEQMGLYFSKPVFNHGQYYVALSRCGKRSNVRMMVVNGRSEDRE